MEVQILQYLPVASALLIGGLTLTSVTLQQGIAVLLFLSVIFITMESVCQFYSMFTKT